MLLLTLLQRKLMYQPTIVPELSPAAMGAEREAADVTTETDDGLTLHGWHWKSRSTAADKPLVLFFHGNGGHRGHRTYDCQLFAECGADTLIFDYRGYAENPGKPSETGLALDARAAWRCATQQLGVPPERIVVFGASLGGAVAVRLSAELCDAGTPPAGLMLRSTFDSMVETAAWHYPWLPVRWVLTDRYPSIDYAPRVRCPVLQMHGDADTIVPIEFGRRLFERFPDRVDSGQPKRWVELPNTGHNDILRSAGPIVLSETRQFLADIAHTR